MDFIFSYCRASTKSLALAMRAQIYVSPACEFVFQIGGLGVYFAFDIFPDWSLWVFSFLMLVGRLEFYTVYTLFARDFWMR